MGDFSLPPILPYAKTLLLLLTVALAGPLRAQTPDTTRVPPQAARPQTDTTETLVPLPLPTSSWGTPIDTLLPTRTPLPNLVDVLGDAPTAFVYDLGAEGWPDGWSVRGLNPQRTHLLLDGHPYEDPVTGRPRFDLLPVEFLEAPQIGADQFGGPNAVYARLRDYDVKRPLTEIRFRRNSNGMQSAGVMHTQQRRIPLFGDPGLFQFVVGFYGRASDGEYPNSDLRRERRLLGRIRYRQRRWSVTLTDLHSRRRLGAQSGVIPQGGIFETIYNRTIANVQDPNARRQTLRNHLNLTVRAPLFPGLREPIMASGYWMTQTFRYWNPDTLFAETNRYGGQLRQDLHLGRHHLQIEVSGFTDRVDESNALSGATSRHRLHATGRDSARFGGTMLELGGGFHTSDIQSYPSATLRLEQRLGPLHLFAQGDLSGQPISWVEQQGFGAVLEPLDTLPSGSILRGEVGLSGDWGPVEARLAGFAHTIRNPIDLYATGRRDTIAARASDTPFQRAGVTASLGWRRGAEAGLYASAQATALRFLNDGASSDHARAAATLPDVFGQARLGARFVAFQGDLDADLYLRGRAWSSFQSRDFHPPTALFVVPGPESVPLFDKRTFGPSGTLDLHLEAGIRGATLFLSYENILSGTALQAGALLVPVYPLPQRQFRFGVFWPIQN